VTRALRRPAVALAGVLLASGGLGLVDAPDAGGRPVAGACTDTAGISVIVDFGSAGGGVQTRCAPAPVRDGFEALRKAGFAIRSVSGQAFLCQIDGKPVDEPCNHVPSASRYWSYWYAQRGQPWTYSSSGASRRPPPGSVEGWSFGSSDPPGAAPPAPVTTPTTRRSTPTTADASPTTGASPTTPGAASSTAARPGDDLGSSTTVAADVGDTGGDGTTTTSRAGAESDGSGSDDDGEQAVEVVDTATAPGDGGGGGGSPVELLAAVVVISALGVSGARTVRRRSAQEAGG